MKFSDVNVIESFAKDISWNFEGRDDRCGGTLLIEIPMMIDTGPLNRNRVLKLRVVIYDTFSASKRQRHVYPPGLELPDDWPFSYRVNILERDASLLDGLNYAGDSVFTVHVRVFALLGVEVRASWAFDNEGFAELAPLTQTATPVTLKVDVDMLPRPESLPIPGAPVNTDMLYPTHPVYPYTTHNIFRRVGRFAVRHVPNGVDITWAATQQTLSLRIKKPGSASGFVYYFNPTPEFTPKNEGFFVYDDLLRIQICGDVHVHLSRPVNPPGDTYRPQSGATKVLTDEDRTELVDFLTRSAIALTASSLYEDSKRKQKEYRRRRVESLIFESHFVDPIAWDDEWSNLPGGSYLDADGKQRQFQRKPETLPPLLRKLPGCRFFRLTKVGGPGELQPFGKRIDISEDEDEAEKNFEEYLRAPPFQMPIAGQIATDVAFGLALPVVSDIADYAELNYALATGKDRWGHEVADWELVLMGLSIIPLAGDIFKIPRWIRRAF